jgi:hypothetical protein
MDKEIRRDLARRFSVALEIFFHVIGDELPEYFLKMFMNDGSPSGPHLGWARFSVAINVFEDRKAESNKPFVSVY